MKRRQAKTVFLEVLELPEADRARAARERCGGDQALHELVAGLLRAHGDAGELLEPITAAVKAFGLPTDSASTTPSITPGDRVGSYRLARVIGEGGFGVVFLAEQEEPIRRRVALKVIKAGMDSAQVAARFAAERQALALMDHPGIARVLDAGTTDHGRPYFVMEFVDGQQITEFCDGRRLTLRERLELFLDVCMAVQHAHQKGVIHRDLKPGNVLVTSVDDRALPKVIDFGIAKAMGPSLGDTAATCDGQLMGTPEYMAPEQAATGSDDIDTRADVYSLGVLLYRLLTGASPYAEERLRPSDLLAWSRAIREEEPPRPSVRVRLLGAAADAHASARRTTRERLARQLARDLDWIVLKALAKDRSRRYPTTAALAADVRRFLDGDTVEATPPSHLYRLGKLWRRHRAASLALAAVFVTAVVAAAVSLSAAHRARQAQADSLVQKQAAETLREVAEQQAYVANMLAAEVSLRSTYVREAARCLAAAPPQRRGWEWHHLQARCDASAVTVRGGPGRALAMAVHPSQPLVATAWEGGALQVVDMASGTTRARTEGGADIDYVAFTPDGDHVAFVSAKGRVAVWEWEADRCRELAPHGERGQHLAVSADGRWLATTGWDRAVLLHDLRDASVRHTLRHSAAVQLVALSPDMRRIATASFDEKLHLWDAESGELITSQRVAYRHTAETRPERFALGNVSALSFDPRGRWLAVAVRDGRVLVVEAETLREVWSTDTHTRIVRAVEWSPDGSRLAAAGREHRATLWSSGDWKRIAELPHTDDIRAVAFSPDGRLLASVAFDRAVRLWNASDGRPRGVLLGHDDGIFDVRFTADGRRLLTHSSDGTVRAWDVNAAARQVLWGHDGFVTTLAFLGDDTLVSSGWQDLRRWDLTRAEVEHVERFEPDHAIGAIAADAAGEGLVIGSQRGVVGIRPTSRAASQPAITAHSDRIRALAFSPDRRSLATASHDDVARLWELPSGRMLAAFEGHTDDVTGIGFAAGGACVVTTSYDGSARLWDAQTGRMLRELTAKRQLGLQALAVHPDGKRIALGAEEEILLTSLDAGSRVQALTGHGDTVVGLAWLPDGSRLVSASRDCTVRLWHPESGECVATLRGHERYVTCLAISPSGRRIAAGSEDSSVRVWEVPSGR